MQSNVQLLEEAKETIKGYEFISINTLKIKLHKGIVTCNLLIDDLKEIEAIDDFGLDNGLYRVLI